MPTQNRNDAAFLSRISVWMQPGHHYLERNRRLICVSAADQLGGC